MHQTRGMCGMQSFGNLLDVVHRESWIEWLSAVFENLAKVLPINQAHIQVQATVDLAVTVDRDHVGFGQTRDRMGFAAEPLLECLILGRRGANPRGLRDRPSR